MPAVPLATWKSISLPSAGRSSAPPSCIGVAIATRLPVSMGMSRGKGAILPHSTAPDGRDAVQRAAISRRDGAAASGASRSDRRDALHDRRAPAVATTALLERDDRRAAPRDEREQLAAARAGNPDSTAGRRPRCRARTSRRAARRRGERGEQIGNERPVQVVGDDDRVEALAGERPRPRLEVDARASRCRRRRRARRAPSASRSTASTSQPRAAKKRAWRPLPAGEIEHARARRQRGARSATIHGDGGERRVGIVAGGHRPSASRAACARTRGRAPARAGAESPRRSCAAASSRSQATNAATSARSRACGATTAK